MGEEYYRPTVQNILDLAGIKINGTRYFDIQVHKSSFIKKWIVRWIQKHKMITDLK